MYNQEKSKTGNTLMEEFNMNQIEVKCDFSKFDNSGESY